ncbi:MAG: DNA gyrase subunit A [Oscillospiraceae bacterium]|nr:DNA gyrase subunit A [Oscillospiraceae bacterium]
MAKKKKTEKKQDTVVEGLRAQVTEQPIVDTLEVNYMPYAMSVIVSRAIPEIDGFKPSHRKLLFTMYKMGLLSGKRTKSANVVGQTMWLNPHGDAAIYETMVRLSRGYEALLHPFVDSKGNFGKIYSRDMAYAASRYTEVKLDPICQELFRDIGADTVDFIPNYDNTMMEPALLPTTFPNILVSANQGIAVGMASMICGFHLGEVCDTAIALMKNPRHNLLSTLKAPDFPTGGALLYDEKAMAEIYRTGRGSFQVQARWRYIKEENLIEIYEIPYTTTAEAILDKVTDLIRTGKLKEISDMRDETGLGGLKLTIDLKRGTDPDRLMARLFRQTPLMDSFSCNFNILVGGTPRLMGVREILEEWTAWRSQCVKRRVYFVLGQKTDRLHLLYGLRTILLDMDKAIRIIRETEREEEVVPNLMTGFGIDQAQADYVAEIRLRHLNRAYILNRLEEVASLEAEVADLSDILDNPGRISKIIISELEQVKKQYQIPRKTLILYETDLPNLSEEEETPDYPVHLFLSREGYFKKITPLSLRMSGDQKYKPGDGPLFTCEAGNRDECLFFTNRQQVYKTRLSEFDDLKASVLGEYLPAKLGMDEGETVCFVCVPGDYGGSLLFFFANGKAARVELSCYQTVTRRRKLTGAYSGKSPLVFAFHLKEEREFALCSTGGRALLFFSSALPPKTTRSVQGVQVMALKARHTVKWALPAEQTAIVHHARYRAKSIPAPGAILKPEDNGERQLDLLER